MKPSYPTQSLCTSATLSLHSAEAIRLWSDPLPEKHQHYGVFSVHACMAKLKRIYHMAASGNSNADSWLWWLEQKRTEAAEHITQLRQRTAKRLQTLPDRLTTQQCRNPGATILTLSQSIISPPGMRVLYLLLDFDLLVGEVVQVCQFALLTNREKKEVLWQGEHTIRALFKLAQKFHEPGAVRKNRVNADQPDIRSNSASKFIGENI